MKAKAIFILPVFLFISLSVDAQKAAGENSKNKWGIGLGSGLSKVHATPTDWETPGSPYYDSLNSITASFIPKFELFLFYQIQLSGNVHLRPAVYTSFGDGGKLTYDKKAGPAESIKLSNAAIVLSLPLLLKLPTTDNRFYLSGGPAFSFLGQDEEVRKQFPLKTIDILADLSVGYDIAVKKIIITPELRTMVGLLNIKKNGDNFYTNTIEKLRRQSLTLSFLIRDKG